MNSQVVVITLGAELPTEAADQIVRILRSRGYTITSVSASAIVATSEWPEPTA